MGRWDHGDRPYDYPFSLDGDQLPRNALEGCWLPDVRRALGGTEDIGTQAWKQRGRDPNARRWFDTLEPNSGRGDRRRWRMFDSFGEELCIIEHDDGCWAISDLDGKEFYRDSVKDRKPRLQLQG